MKLKLFFIIIILLLSQINISFADNSKEELQEKIFKEKYQNDRLDNKQKAIEIIKVSQLKKSLSQTNEESFIYKLISWDRKLIITNDNFEFVDWRDIKRIIFTQYYNITDWDYDLVKDKKWLIINKVWTKEFMLVEDYEIETKVPYSQISKYTKWYLTSKSRYILENWNYYGFLFDNSIYFPDESYWLYLKLFKEDISKIFLYKTDEWKYSFIKDYKRIKLINSSIIYWIVGKYNFLKELSEDLSTPWFQNSNNEDYDEIFKKLKKETSSLAYGLNKDEITKKIYSLVLENISYSKEIDFSDKTFFSWIDTYKNKSWVCSWYARLFLYMLSFAWIEDVEVIKWDVIDAPDFPTIWHAWARVWEYYYDPTFDDPIGWKNKKFEELKYYKLNKDLFYTNRYDMWYTPSDLKKSTISYRKNIVKKNIGSLITKYKNSWLILLKPYVFRDKNWFSYNEKITITKLKKIIKFYKVSNEYIDINSQKKFIKNVDYLAVNDKNIEIALEQLNYEVSKLYFLEWDLWNWKTEYRIALNIVFE